MDVTHAARNKGVQRCENYTLCNRDHWHFICLLFSFVLSSLVLSFVFHLFSLSLALSSFSVYLCLCLRVMLCVVLWCVPLKTTVSPFKTSPCMPAPRTWWNTCACGASTHGDVLNGHTGGRGGIVTSAYQNLPTQGYHLLQRFTKRNPWIQPIFWSLRIGREQHVPDSSVHSLYLMKLLSSSSPEGHCEGNQPRDGSICLSPFSEIYRTICTSISLLHQGSLDVALLKIRSPSHNYTQQNTTHKHTYTQIHTFTHVYKHKTTCTYT